MRQLFISILISLTALFPQFRENEIQTDPRLKLMSPSHGSIFDMSKITVSHSVSMSYVNTGSNSTMINEYVAGINYRISDPLTLRLNLGMSYTPYSSFAPVEDNSTDVYLKSATLDYRPNDSFRMRIDFRNVTPADYMNNDPFRHNDYLKDEE